MKKKFYKCQNCGQKFGRRWNASRHSRLIHGSTSSIIGNDVKPRTSLMSYNRVYNYDKKFKILDQTDLEVYNEYDSSDIFSLNLDDLKIIKIIDQLIKPFNELEELLIDTDQKTRVFILSKVLM